MSSPAPPASCTACGYGWRSAAMIDGLRLIGSCPRCNGELAFAADAPGRRAEPAAVAAVAPHLVLGVPRLC